MAPAISLIEKSANSIPDDLERFTLSLAPFAVNILFGIINQIKSVSLLITEIKSSDDAKTLGLINASKSMYSDAFFRYNVGSFKVFDVNIALTLLHYK